MTKYYFIGYNVRSKDGTIIAGNNVVRVTDGSLKELEELIAERKGHSSVVITSLKDLSREEFEMLRNEK